MHSILIPVYNEASILEENMLRLHAYVTARLEKFEIIIVSNGSTDETEVIAGRLADTVPGVRFLSHPERGVGAAFILGVQAAKGDYIITLDADLSSELIFIDYATHLLHYADMVVGSKSMGKQRRGPVRIFGSQAYLLIAQLLFGLTLSDYSIGSKAYRRKTLEPVLEKLDTWTAFVFELALYMKLNGRKVVQIGIDCDDRRKSHFNLFHEGFYRFWHLFSVWRRVRRGSPPISE